MTKIIIAMTTFQINVIQGRLPKNPNIVIGCGCKQLDILFTLSLKLDVMHFL
jgi:hypothetical protein